MTPANDMDFTACTIMLANIRERAVAALALKLYCRTLWPMRKTQVLRDDIKATVKVLRKMPHKISRKGMSELHGGSGYGAGQSIHAPGPRA